MFTMPKRFKRMLKKKPLPKKFISRVKKSMTSSYSRKMASRALSVNTRNLSDPFPNTKICYLRYAESYLLTSGVGGISTQYQFRLNSLFDPDKTYAGHQPYGFDQLVSFYTHLAVLGCYYKITLTYSTNAANVFYLNLCTEEEYQSKAGLQYSELKEKGDCVLRSCNVLMTKPVIVKGYVDMPKRFSNDFKGMRAQNFLYWRNDSGNGPTQEMLLNMGCVNVAGTANTDIGMTIDLCYKVYCFDPVTQSTS